MQVLGELLARARERAAALDPLEWPTPERASTPSFRDAIAGRDTVAVIAEFKRCSPSLGSIRDGASVTERVTAYAAGGAAAISVLTEPSRFGGSYEDLSKTLAAVPSVPVLMKDFIVSPVQIEHAAALGAAAVLLIVRCLSNRELDELAQVCRGAGVTPLVECHDADEIRRALVVEDAVIGFNHRDLSTLKIDCERGRKLMAEISADRVVVSESGVLSPGEVREFHGVADAVLIGTALMRADDPSEFLREALS